MSGLVRAMASLVVLLALAGCENWPRDPERSTEMIKETGRLRVAILHNPPWTDVRNGITGIEAELAREFAASLGAQVEWQALAANNAFAALENGDVDMVIGGLVDATPYVTKAGLSRPYTITRSPYTADEERHVLAVRRGENRLLVALEKFLARQPDKRFPGVRP